MSLRSRILGEANSSVNEAATPPESEKAGSNFVIILAALLCALICVLGLVAAGCCVWIRRRISGGEIGRSAFPQPPANKGLKKKILNSLPKLIYTAENSAKFSDCPICLMEFVAGDEFRVLPQCGHGFHLVCIDTWLGSHSSCPSCRQNLVAARCQKCGGLPSISVARAEISAGPEQSGGDSVNSFLP